jgi:hypothetical protein
MFCVLEIYLHDLPSVLSLNSTVPEYFLHCLCIKCLLRIHWPEPKKPPGVLHGTTFLPPHHCRHGPCDGTGHLQCWEVRMVHHKTLSLFFIQRAVSLDWTCLKMISLNRPGIGPKMLDLKTLKNIILVLLLGLWSSYATHTKHLPIHLFIGQQLLTLAGLLFALAASKILWPIRIFFSTFPC